LFQKTNFEFEILLGEDDSNDGTRELCEDYAKRYPDKIRLFLHHRENNIKIGGQPTGRFNFLYNLHSSKGKYIALCEGDDYWTDPLKLQKQVDFLEGNLDFTGIGTNSEILIQETHEKRYFRKTTKDEVLVINNFLKKRFFHTASFMFINDNTILNNFTTVLSADRLLFLFIATKGKVFYKNEVTCVYRKNIGGISKRVTSSQMIKDLKILKITNSYLDKNQMGILKKFILKTIFEYSHSIKLSHFIRVSIKLLMVSRFDYKTLRILKKNFKKVEI
jgi:glycosyltransferase involved in cell wall biosynthesis